MPDHIHLLFQLGEKADLQKVMQSFGSFTGLQAYRQTGRGPLWKLGYHDHSLRAETEISSIVWYIEQNPVKAELVEQAEEWEWSSVEWQSNSSQD